jgi:hypothetical protein
MRTVWTLIAVFMAVTLADSYTTWACLRAPISGWEVIEANPASAWLFASLGLVPGLVVDGLGTVLVLGWIGYTKIITPKFKSAFLLLLIAASGWAAYNNYQGMIDMGIA